MAFRSLAGRAGVAAAAAVTATAAGSSTAHARAPPTVQAPVHAAAPPSKGDSDEWLVTHHGPQGDVILFKPFQPYEIEEAVADVASFMRPHGVMGASSHVLPLSSAPGAPTDGAAAAEGAPLLGTGTSTPTTEGSQANLEITRACLTGGSLPLWGDSTSAGGGDGSGRNGMDMMTLLNLTNKMLRRPGMQAEIVTAMMEDPEIASIMLRECPDLDNYLLAAGVAPAVGLLPPAAAAAAAMTPAVPGAGDDFNFLANAVNAVVSALEHAGSGMGRLFGWLRARLALLLPQAPAAAADEATAEGAAEAPRQGRNAGRFFLQSVLTVATIVVVVMIFKRPPTALSFVRRAGGAAAAAAGAAAAARARGSR